VDEMKQAQVCPVCEGRGEVAAGFYMDSTTSAPEKCKSCWGCGYIVIDQNDDGE